MSQRDRIISYPFTVTILNGQTTGTATGLPSYINGMLQMLYLKAPAMTGTAWDYTLLCPGNALAADSTGFSNAPNSELGGSLGVNNIPLDGSVTLTITSNATEAASRTFTGQLLVDRGNS